MHIDTFQFLAFRIVETWDSSFCSYDLLASRFQFLIFFGYRKPETYILLRYSYLIYIHIRICSYILFWYLIFHIYIYIFIRSNTTFKHFDIVIDNVYNCNEQCPRLPCFVIVEFLYYKEPLLYAFNPTYVPISRITKTSLNV